jgi:peroxiredoxin
MAELGQLEAEHQKFDDRKVRIVAASLDGIEDSEATQKRFPHLTIVSDKEKSLAHAAAVIGPQHAPDGGETVAPTTVLIDRNGHVKRVIRQWNYLNRLSPGELFAEVEQHLPREK